MRRKSVDAKSLELLAARQVHPVECLMFDLDDIRDDSIMCTTKKFMWHTTDDALFDTQEEAIKHQVKYLTELEVKDDKNRKC